MFHRRVIRVGLRSGGLKGDHIVETASEHIAREELRLSRGDRSGVRCTSGGGAGESESGGECK